MASVTLHGVFSDGGVSASGWLTFTDVAFSVDPTNGVISVPSTTVAYLDQNGEFYLQLGLNTATDLTPAPRAYDVTVSVAGHNTSFTFVLAPTSHTVEFATLMPVTSAPTLPTQYVISVAGLTGVISYDDLVSQIVELNPGTGLSAYDLWHEDHIGTVDDFLAALVGAQGIQGIQGVPGPVGQPGMQGPRGSVGPPGRGFTIAGSVANQAALPTTWPASTVMVTMDNYHLWVYTGVSWLDLGSHQGPPGVPGVVTFTPQLKIDLGISNVNNTSDLAKPISTLTQAALDSISAGGVQTVNSIAADVGGNILITKTELDLDLVENIAPADLPLSSAEIDAISDITTALTTKQALLPSGGSSANFLRGDSTWQGLTKTTVGLDKVDNISSMVLITSEALNNFHDTGTWFQPSNTAAAVGGNYPEARAGLLEVYRSPGTTAQIIQRYTTYGETTTVPRTYTRGYYNTTWTAWRLLAPVFAMGTATLTPAGSSVVTSMPLTFPTGRFSTTPAVFLTPNTTGPTTVSMGVMGITTTGCTVYAYRTGTGLFTYQWLAIGE